MIRLPYLSAARFSGPDAASFLQAQLSADIDALDDGKSTFAAYCSPQGKVFGLLLVGRENETYLVIASAQLLPSIIQRLRIYVFRAKVEIEFLNDKQICGVSSSLVEDPSIPVLAPADIGLRYAIVSSDFDRDDESEQWRFKELSLGVAWLDANTSEKHIPQMLAYEELGAVSFSKGCYPGQEIVARTYYLGKVKRKPLLVTAIGKVVIENGSRVKVDYEDESANGILVDTAPAGSENTLMFIITRAEDEKKPASITHDGQSYSSVIQ